MTNTNERSICLVVLAFLLIVAGYVTTTWASDGPSPADLENLEDIKRNQKVIEENREAYEAFVAAKKWNEAESAELAKNGFCVKWDTLTLERCDFTKGPESPENLHQAATEPSEVTVWVWKDAPDYKNERLKAYQGMLKARGIKDPDQLKLLTAQIIQENGSLSENVHGDNGCSVGVLQYNACVHHKQSAKAFLESHPEWKSWEYQFERMADMVANRMDIYDGNMHQVVTHHNCPACAKRGVDTKVGYYRSVKSRTSLLQAL